MQIHRYIGLSMALATILMQPEIHGDTHHVNINNATPLAPYTTWARAATNIQQAVDASVSGDTILVDDGTYLLSAEINVTKDIQIESVNGPNFTIIDGGGAVRCFSLRNTRSLLKGLTITNGFTTGFGGGIHCSSRNPVVTNCTIIGNSAQQGGGGMHSGTANNCTISGNLAISGGGMIWGTANDCTISSNSASFGGGLTSSIGNNCMISGNSVTNYGGGMQNGTANNCTITKNSARHGGGLYDATATNCTISGNSASLGGGMVRGAATNCTISGNSASHNGGGLYGTTAHNCTISENSANWDGGGMFYGAAINCTIRGNSTNIGDGGGMRSGTATNCTFSGNSAHDGGGLDYSTANNCTISSNSASTGGGGTSSTTANNCMISGNSARFGGGVYYGTAINCTISGNSASNSGGGMRGGAAINCIVWYNTGGGNLEQNIGVRSCSSPNVTHGVNGNITNAPLFVDKATGNYHLQSNSPCINWGNNADVGSTVDLDENPRIVGGYVDMGAYEYQTDLGPDIDSDGIPDEWEQAFFGSNILPMENADEDPHSNMDEYIAGTDPTNSASFFTASSSLAEVNGTNCFVVEWISIPDRFYRIEWTDNLIYGFQTVEANIEYPHNSYTGTTYTAESQGFYQVEVRVK